MGQNQQDSLRPCWGPPKLHSTTKPVGFIWHCHRRWFCRPVSMVLAVPSMDSKPLQWLLIRWEMPGIVRFKRSMKQPSLRVCLRVHGTVHPQGFAMASSVLSMVLTSRPRVKTASRMGLSSLSTAEATSVMRAQIWTATAFSTPKSATRGQEPARHLSSMTSIVTVR